MTNYIDTSPAALRKLAEPKTYLRSYGDRVIVFEAGTGHLVCVFDMHELLTIAAEKEAQAKQEPFTDWPEFHEQAMGAGLEDRGIRSKYEAMKYGWDQAIEAMAERLIPLPATTTQHLSQLMMGGGHQAKQPAQPLEMVAPAEVLLPEMSAEDRQLLHDNPNTDDVVQFVHQYAEAYAKAAVAAELEMREALELIAAPKRPDGTWNRDREACRQLAAEALGRYDEKQKRM